MKKIYSMAVIVLAFFGGVTVTSIIARTDMQERFHESSHDGLAGINNNSKSLLAVEKKIDNLPLSVSGSNGERLSVVEHKLGNILSVLMGIQGQIETISMADQQLAQSDHLIVEKNIDTDKDVANIHVKDILSDDEENSIKDNIISSLSYPETTVQTILNSKEVNSLSPAMQKEVFTEIAKQLDSGVIDKERFLPGFKQKEPSE